MGTAPSPPSCPALLFWEISGCFPKPRCVPSRRSPDLCPSGQAPRARFGEEGWGRAVEFGSWRPAGAVNGSPGPAGASGAAPALRGLGAGDGHPSPASPLAPVLGTAGGWILAQGWASPSPSSTGWTGATPSLVSPHWGGHGAAAEPSRPRRQPCQPAGHPAHPARRALALAAGRARLAPAPGRAAVGAQLPAAG